MRIGLGFCCLVMLTGCNGLGSLFGTAATLDPAEKAELTAQYAEVKTSLSSTLAEISSLKERFLDLIKGLGEGRLPKEELAALFDQFKAVVSETRALTENTAQLGQKVEGAINRPPPAPAPAGKPMRWWELALSIGLPMLGLGGGYKVVQSIRNSPAGKFLG